MCTQSTGLYEAGAFAALGIIWSLRRMQKKWEAARSFWENEVREEGKKAVRFDSNGRINPRLKLTPKTSFRSPYDNDKTTHI